MPAEWRWWLCNSSDMSQIAELEAHNKQLQVQLNGGGKASCWLHLLDPNTAYVVEHQTALRLDRNGETVWSGPVYQTQESSQASTGSEEGQDQLQVTALGWTQILNQRLVHTGAEFQAMLAASSGAAWQAQNGAYVQAGIDTAVQLAYSVAQFSNTTDAAIIYDLLNRANIDGPTLITPGTIYGFPIQRNLTLQRFQNVGQQISQLVQVESGCDFYVDPVTRKMNLFGPGASPSSVIANGMGVDRGNHTVFTYPGNCISFQRTRDGTKTANRVEAVGQFGVGRADAIGSQQSNLILEDQNALSEVVDPNILTAFANVEVTVRQDPWTIITFDPRGVIASDARAPGVPQPFDDYNLGDLVYCVIRRGPRVQIGAQGGAPQAIRVFGFTVSIDDNGVEKVTQLQTTNQGLGAV